jgi:hypothetical protein
VPLTARCVIGRSPAAGLVIQERFASAEHARVAYVSDGWELKDLGSKNGTFVDGRRVEPRKPVILGVGARLGFGQPDGWVLEDDGPPAALATELGTRERFEATNEILVLGGADSADAVSVFRAESGAWVSEESDGTKHPVQDGSIVTANGRHYRLELPGPVEATPLAESARTLDHLTLRFVVSRDEEHVEVSVVFGGRPERLERRWFGYPWLTLARARRDDQALPLEERGWRSVELLSRMLKIDLNAINVATHEIRRQLASVGVEGAPGVVEVRRGQRRLGIDRLEIEEPSS